MKLGRCLLARARRWVKESARSAQEPLVRTAPWRTVDRTFAAIVAGVFLFNFGVAQAITAREGHPAVEPAFVEDLHHVGGRLLLPRPLSPIPPVALPAPVIQLVLSPRTTRAPSRAPRPSVGPDPAGMREAILRSGLPNAIRRLERDGSDSAVDELMNGRESRSVEEAVREAGQGGGNGFELEAGPGRRGGSGSGIEGIDDLHTPGGAHPSTTGLSGQRSLHTPQVSFEDSDSEDDARAPSAGCDGPAIARQMKKNLRAIQVCYEQEIKRTPTLQGKLVVRLTISPQGTATDVEFDEDTVGSSGLAHCVERAFRRWRYPSGSEECVVAHPFVFAPVP
ncbi:MAG: AgmX/PglI C-terminal domain-containing protein [Deltaproteobacteria bacterium]|nr:AgmX/PglI C-terminal domain-containing protein [Deltaproteobacteria bacterium]